MENVTQTISDKQLEQLGIIEAQPVAAPKQQTKSDMPEMPDFLKREKRTTKKPDTRGKSWTPKTSRHAPDNWKQDGVLAKLDEMRREYWECIGADATISKDNFDGMVSVLSGDFLNALEQAGLIIQSGNSATRLRELLSAWIQADTKYGNGEMYRYVKVREIGQAETNQG